MAQENLQSNEQQAAPTRDIPKDQWNTFFAQFTRENRGAHARVEVIGLDVGGQVEAEDRPFDGISADVKDGEDAVWIVFGSSTADHVTHGIQKVKAIRVRPPMGDSGAALEVVGDGQTTLLELSRPDAYALPGAASNR